MQQAREFTWQVGVFPTEVTLLHICQRFESGLSWEGAASLLPLWFTVNDLFILSRLHSIKLLLCISVYG